MLATNNWKINFRKKSLMLTSKTSYPRAKTYNTKYLYLNLQNMIEEIKELKLFSWIRRLSIVKMSNLPKSVHRVNTITPNIP